MVDIGPARKTSGVRTGGRSERIVASVIEAALAELAAVGYGALRLEDVATRAGVAKTTIYRRWPTKLDLIEDAFRIVTPFNEPLPDTGAVRTDIVALIDRSIALLKTEHGRALSRMITTESGDDDFMRIAKTMRDESRVYRARIVEAAIARGELPADTDATIVMDAVFTPIMIRIVKYGETIDRKTRERIVDLVVTGAEHGGGRKKR